jgi:hypothetical protein
VEIGILEIKEGTYIFFKGHVDRISRTTIPPNQGDVIAWKKDPEAFRESKDKHTRIYDLTHVRKEVQMLRVN